MKSSPSSMDTNKNITEINDRLERLKIKLGTVKDIRPTDIVFLKKDKKILGRDEFESEEFMRGYVKADAEDIDVGDFVRYKTKRSDEPVKYLWGGVVIFKDPGKQYLRIKNPYMNRVWSVQLTSPEVRHVFYVRKKPSEIAYGLDQDGEYTNLKTASAEGLIARAVGRDGGAKLILETANEIRKNNKITYLL